MVPENISVGVWEKERDRDKANLQNATISESKQKLYGCS